MATAEASDPNTDALGNTIPDGVFDRSIDTLISRLRAQIEPVWRRATILKSVE